MWMSRTSSVIAIANTPSLNASVRPVSQRLPTWRSSTHRVRVLAALVQSPSVHVFTYADRPDLAARTGEIQDTLPEFTGHGEIPLRHWGKLRHELPELQLVLWDDERDAVVGHARTMPAREADGLPGGIDDILETWLGD